MRLKKFESVEELEAYMAHEDYEKNRTSHPGLCFAFAIEDHAIEDRFHLRMYFDDS